MKRRFALPLLTLTLIAGGCSRHETNGENPDRAGTQTVVIPSVPTVRVARADVSGAITLTGEFVPYQEVDVMSKVAGYIQSIEVDIGDRVHAGQVLATLEVPEIEDEMSRASAAIEQANAESTRAEDDLKRAQSGHDIAHLSLTRVENVANKEPGLVPQQEVDEVRSRDLEAEAQVSAAKSTLNAAHEHIRMLQADESRLKTMRGYQTITAPFDGVVVKRYASKGSMIQAGTASQTQAMPVVRVAENSLLRLMLPVPESSVPRVSVGRPVNVRVPSLGRTFAGVVRRFTDNLQLSTRTMDTEVDVPNPSLTLIPGMYAEVDLELQEHKKGLVLPPDAIEGTGVNARVFAVSPGNVIRIVPVQIGIEMAQRTEIVSGVAEGDVAVAGRRAGLKEGDRVKPMPAAFVTSK